MLLRREGYEDFEAEVLAPINGEFGLGVDEERKFNRKPLSAGAAVQRELLHLDRDTKDQRPSYPFALTMSRLDEGKGLFVVGGASSKTGAWTEQEYVKQRARLNEDPAVTALRLPNPDDTYNVVKHVQHKGLRGANWRRRHAPT